METFGIDSRVAANLAARSATTFNADDVVRELARQGSSYQESTIRTHVASVMCADAPVHHQNHTNDLRRVGRARYALINPVPRTISRPPTTVVAEEPLSAPELAAGVPPSSARPRWKQFPARRPPGHPAGSREAEAYGRQRRHRRRCQPRAGRLGRDMGTPRPAQSCSEAQGAQRRTQTHIRRSRARRAASARIPKGALLLRRTSRRALPAIIMAGRRLARHGIEIAVVDLGPEWRQRIRDAQERQFR